MKPSKEKIKGVVNNVSGKMKEAAGSMSDDSKLKIKGELQQIKGKIQVASANVKEAIQKKLSTKS